MKFMIIAVVMLMVMPFGVSHAAESQNVNSTTQLREIEQKISHLRMLVLARVLGTSTTNYFKVTSDTNIIAQSYVPVTATVAQEWCDDMKSMDSFKNTTVVCTHNGVAI